MAVVTTGDVNEHHEPSDSEEKALEVLKEGRGTGNPWGRVSPLLVRERADVKKSTAEYALRQLRTAGWVTQPVEGMYEFVGDPREVCDE
ncbi:MarR family transcriptional regulator [Halomarina oriensis]|uniref:MarR family transcriptional regulator n=1 Tax=Halomarina oriensis TaxID=671145 RepID=A0A6B0GP10_9EURY|nr:MarR family transcriptional regulator [Halomarina oriensis]MWG36534.1 MarR family transcriptional regulator [Halomarina oriensis]